MGFTLPLCCRHRRKISPQKIRAACGYHAASLPMPGEENKGTCGGGKCSKTRVACGDHAAPLSMVGKETPLLLMG